MIDSATSLFTNMWQKYVNCLDYVQKFALEVQEFCILVFLLCLTLYGSHWLFFRYHTGCLRRCIQVKRGEIEDMDPKCAMCQETSWMSKRVHKPFGCPHVFCEGCVAKLLCREWHNPCEGKFAACPVDKSQVMHGFSIFN